MAAAKAKSIKIREGYDKVNELRRNQAIQIAEVVEVVDPVFAMIDNIGIVNVDNIAQCSCCPGLRSG